MTSRSCQISLIWIKFFPGGLCPVQKYRGLNIFAKAATPPVHSDKPRTASAPPILCSGKIWLKRKQIQNPSPGVTPPAIMPKSSQAKRPLAHEWSLSSVILTPNFGTLIEWLPNAFRLLIILYFGAKRMKVYQRQWSSGSLMLLWFAGCPWRNWPPSTYHSPQIIINLQILTPRYFTQVTPEMFENNICYVGSDLVQTQM